MKEWTEIVGFVVLIAGVLVNIAISIFGRPKTMQEVSGKLDNLDKNHELLRLQVSNISDQLNKQGQKLDAYIDKCADCTNRIGIMEYKIGKGKRLYRRKDDPVIMRGRKSSSKRSELKAN